MEDKPIAMLKCKSCGKEIPFYDEGNDLVNAIHEKVAEQKYCWDCAKNHPRKRRR